MRSFMCTLTNDQIHFELEKLRPLNQLPSLSIVRSAYHLTTCIIKFSKCMSLHYYFSQVMSIIFPINKTEDFNYQLNTSVCHTKSHPTPTQKKSKELTS